MKTRRTKKKAQAEILRLFYEAKEAKRKSSDQSLDDAEAYDNSVLENKVEENLSEPPPSLVETAIIDYSPYRVSLAATQSRTSRVDETFQIMPLVKSVIDYMKKPETSLEPDDMFPLIGGEDTSYTKGEWARECQSI